MRVVIPGNYSFQSYKIKSTVGVDIHLDSSFQSYQTLDNFKSWTSCRFKSYQKPGRNYAPRQLSELTTQLFGATKILSTVGVDIPADYSFQCYQYPNNFQSWRSCSFQSYQKPGKHYASPQLLELTTYFL